MEELEENVENGELEDAAEEEIEELSLDDIEFEGRSLQTWESLFTVELPSLPAGSNEVSNCVVKISNSYQTAYNAFNRLMVLTSRIEGQYKSEKYRLCNSYIDKMKDSGAKRIPAKETVEAIVINNTSNTKLRSLLNEYKKYCAVKDWFENHKTKLEKVMIVAKDLLYHTGGSERMYNRAGNIGSGL